MIQKDFQFIFHKISLELERIDAFNNNIKIASDLNLEKLILIDGFDSESTITKTEFEKKISSNLKSLNRVKFLKGMVQNDISNILDSFKNTLLESLEIHKLFKEMLESADLLINKSIKRDSIIISKSDKTTLIIGLLSSSIIKMMSSLDILVKYCKAIEDKELFDYSIYHKLDNKVLFGNAKHLKKLKGKKYCITDISNDMKILENLRNDFIHNNSINSFNRIYLKIKQGTIIDRYILLPDNENGNFTKYINRNRFFSKENKFNDFIPKVYSEILDKILVTLKQY